MNTRTRKGAKATNPELGDQVKDKISGFTGIVTSVTDFIAGCRRIGVTPQELKLDGSPIEIQAFDEPNLEVLGKKVVPPAVKHVKSEFKLGDKAKHKINGFEGVVTSITTYLAEDVPGISITPEKLHDGKPVEDKHFPGTMMEKVKTQKYKEPKNKPTGGPQALPRMIK